MFNDDNRAARGKDQVAIVFALNLYGADRPGFGTRLNRIMKELAKGSVKEALCVTVLMRAQMELQRFEISLVDFVDRELILLVNRKTKACKGWRIALMTALMVGGAIGAPGCAIGGALVLTPVCAGLLIYGLVKLVFWICIPVFKEEEIGASVRPLGEPGITQ